MDEDATWYRSRPRPRPHCVSPGPSFPAKGAEQPPPLFSAQVYCGDGRPPSQLLLSSCYQNAPEQFLSRQKPKNFLGNIEPIHWLPSEEETSIPNGTSISCVSMFLFSIVIQVGSVVRRSLSDGHSYEPQKTVEPIQMPFGLWTRVGPKKHY